MTTYQFELKNIEDKKVKKIEDRIKSKLNREEQFEFLRLIMLYNDKEKKIERKKIWELFIGMMNNFTREEVHLLGINLLINLYK